RQQLNIMAIKFMILSSLVAAAALADQIPSYEPPTPPAYGPAQPEEPAKYDFNYLVKDDPSANDFGHQEARDGAYTSGSYYVQLPDGRLQKVSYTVDGDSGYVAEVTYEGEAQYPAAAPSGYQPPAPAY
ncbi:unnamed protein product, partial [Meganyctiphanes norvegica]